MPNDIPQADLVEEPINEAEVPEQTPESGSAEAELPKERLTLEQIESLLANGLKRIESTIQSQVAKSENRINKRIGERITELNSVSKSLGLTEEQVKVAKDSIIREEQMKVYEPEIAQGSENLSPDAGTETQETRFFNTIEQIQTREGVRLTDTDEEWKKGVSPLWRDPNADPLDVLLAVKQAAKDKKARLDSLKQSSSARVTSGGTQQSNSSNISNIDDSATLYEIGDKMLRDKNR